MSENQRGNYSSVRSRQSVVSGLISQFGAGLGPYTLIQGESGKRIVITQLQVQGESATACTLQLLDGTRVVYRLLMQNQGDGAGYGDLDWRMTPSAALNVTISAAVAVSIVVGYVTENA